MEKLLEFLESHSKETKIGRSTNQESLVYISVSYLETNGTWKIFCWKNQ